MALRVLITGAAGNLGRKLSAHFAALGWAVTGIDRAASAGVAGHDLAVWHDDWVGLFAGVDAVIHLAGDPRPAAPWASIQRENIDLILNVYEAAARQGAKRLIFASSNWTMAGRRHGDGVLRTDLEPAPVNPYGVSKLIGERLGRSYHARWGLSVVCFRIGYCQQGDNLPGPQMGWGRWGQEMWLSNRDLCGAMERAVLADGLGFAVLNLMSNNPGMRWDIATTEAVLGWRALDGAAASVTPQAEAQTQSARLTDALARQLAALDGERRW